MRNKVFALMLVCASSAALADDVEITCGSCKDDFQSMAEDLVATIDYKAAGPAEATGITGFGLGLVTTYVPVDKGEWERVTGSADFSAIGLVGLQATKGLPFGIDLGLFYATAPGSNVDAIGGEVRYAFLKGGVATPAVALRLSHVVVSGIDSFDLDSTALDLGVSKGFGPFTPYGGVGYVKGSADPKGSGSTAVGGEAKVDEMKLYAGARLSLGLIEFTPEIDKVGDVTSYSLRIGFSI
jgi:hypothetical protein